MKLIMFATMDCWWSSALLLIIIGRTHGRGEYDVRLEGGTDPHRYSEGRLEVYVNGASGPVCSVNWNTVDATVVCRQLGYNLGGEATRGLAHFGNGSGEAVIGDVSCRGSERSLGDCPMTLRPYCEEKDRSAGVICNEVAYYDDRYNEGEVRLIGPDPKNENVGTVEVYYSKRWNTVCDEGWDMNDASVVCRQLGYPKASKYTKHASFGRGSGLVLTSRVACSGSETRLLDCPHSDLYKTGCDHSGDAGVRCEGKRAYGALRLVDGDTNKEGRLEIYYDGRWGTVCDAGWTKTAANVACREMGFEYAEVENATFPSGTGPIYLKDLDCSDSHEGLVHGCGYSGWDVSFTCNHDNDVGIICHPGSLSAVTIVVIVVLCVFGVILLAFFIKRCIRIRKFAKGSRRTPTEPVSTTAPPATYSPNQEAVTMGTIDQPPSYDAAQQQSPGYQQLPTTDGHVEA